LHGKNAVRIEAKCAKIENINDSYLSKKIKSTVAILAQPVIT